MSILLIAALGLYSKFYAGYGAAWVNDSLGGVFYVVFWCLLFGFLTNRLKPWRIAAGVLAVTSALEFAQLWHPPLLEAIRSHFLGRALLGNSFAWSDFPYYLVGGGLGYYWLNSLRSGTVGGSQVPTNDG